MSENIDTSTETAERLAGALGAEGRWAEMPWLQTAAAALRALAAERDTYKARSVDQAMELNARDLANDMLESERDAARAEVAKLQAELKDVLQWAVTEKAPLRDQEIASIRAALAQKEPAP